MAAIELAGKVPDTRVVPYIASIQQAGFVAVARMVLNLTTICKTRRTTDGAAVTGIVTHLSGIVLASAKTMARIVAHFTVVI